MRRIGQNSISRKLTSVNMLVSGVALLLACSALFAYDFYTFRVGVVSNLSTDGQIVGSNTVSAILFTDQRAAESTLLALTASPHILNAGIYTLDRQLFASYRRGGKSQARRLPIIPAGQIEMHWFDGNEISLVRSIVFQGKPIGFVYLRSDLHAMNDRLKSYALIVTVVMLVSLIAALLISRMSQRVISAPIVQLAETARMISRQKDYSIRFPASSNHDELATLVEAFNEMLTEIQRRDTALTEAHDELERRVQERTTQLAAANKELEAFSYSVAHDLRTPLRSIDGFSQAVLEDYGEKLDSDGKNYLQRVRGATQRMSGLIDDLLNLSRVTRSEMHKESLNLSAIAKSVAAELQKSGPNRPVEFVIEENLVASGDSRLLRVVIENLLGNAWKYTTRHGRARIEVGRFQGDNGREVCFVRDDGAGFDPRYAARLFGAFQRLHSTDEFPGTGIGLATVQRIIRRHGGEIWAEAAVEKGATFFFTL
ncbi:MAG TPA: ATP-binding protein [Bryobacteraceae bacterium]|jgi:signal transduction histidine kinase|nr:ATP-binding protein [Bryobacteraceae bacterium]